MPPKKKARTGSSGASNNKLAGQVPQTMDDVCAARLLLRDWIVEAYRGRHGFSEERKYPLNNGGSFLDIVQKCWSGEIVRDSVNFLKKIGLVDSAATESDFLDKHCTMKDGILGRTQSGNKCLTSTRLVWYQKNH